MRQLVRNNAPGKAPNANSDVSWEWWMENLCMQYLVVNFLKWVVTSCVMWGIPTCQSTPSYAAKYPQMEFRGAGVHRVHPIPLDRRERVVRQARQVPDTHQDPVATVQVRGQAAAVDPDPVEATALPDRPESQGPTQILDRAALRVQVELRDPAAHPEAQVRVEALALPAQVVPQSVQAHRVHQRVPVVPEHQRVQAHLVAQALRPLVVLQALVVPNHLAVMDRKVAQSHNPDLAPYLDRPLVPRVVAHHRNQAQHQQVLAETAPEKVAQVSADPSQAENLQVAPTAVALVQADPKPALDQRADLDRAPWVSAQAVSVPVAREVPGNPTVRKAPVVARQLAVAPVHPVDAVARAITSGMDSCGPRSLFPIHALRLLGQYRNFVFARDTSQPFQVRISVKPFTQDVSQSRND